MILEEDCMCICVCVCGIQNAIVGSKVSEAVNVIMETSVEKYLRVKMWNDSEFCEFYVGIFFLLTEKPSGLN